MRSITILLAFLAIIAGEAVGQKYDFFSIDDGQLTWSRNYESELPPDSLLVVLRDMIQSKIYVQNAFLNETGIRGELKHYKVDCERYGRKYSDTPLIYWSGEWTARFEIQMTTEGYRVQVYDLHFQNTESPHVTRVPQKPPRSGYYINEVWIPKRRRFRSSMLEGMSLMSVSLKDVFDLEISISK